MTPRRKLFEAVIEVDENGFVHARGENFTNADWQVDTLSQDAENGNVAFGLLIRGQMPGEVVRDASGGAVVRVPALVDGGERPRKGGEAP